ELAGLTRGTQYDAIDVSGTASLAGTANIIHFGGFTPSAGDSFQVINAAGGRSGTFATVNAPFASSYNTLYNPNDVTFQPLTALVLNEWSVDASGDWNTATNWSTVVVPT